MVFVVSVLPSVVEDTVDNADVVESDAFVDEEVGSGSVEVICVGWTKPFAYWVVDLVHFVGFVPVWI